MFRRILSPLPSLRTTSATAASSIRLNNTYRHFNASRPLTNMASLKLYSFPTPNGVPISIFLEELKEVYGGPEYEYAHLRYLYALEISQSYQSNQNVHPWLRNRKSPQPSQAAMVHRHQSKWSYPRHNSRRFPRFRDLCDLALPCSPLWQGQQVQLGPQGWG